MKKLAFLLSGIAYAFALAFGGSIQDTISTESVNLNNTLRLSGSCDMPCRYRLCEYDIHDINVVKRPNGAMILLPPRNGIASYPWICTEDDSVKMGAIIAADEIEVKADDGTYQKISLFTPATLYTRFSRKTIYPLRMNAPLNSNRSGLAIRRKLSADQRESLEERCVMMKIKKYEVLLPGGGTKILRDRGPENCLSFKASANMPDISIQLHWTNQDDMDLSVKEPDGTVISHRTRTSASGGRISKDITKGNCDLRNQEREVHESIEWSSSASPLRGDYEVSVIHYDSCKKGGLEWFLFVDVDGVNFFFETGVHDLTPGKNRGTVTDVLIDTFIVTFTS